MLTVFGASAQAVFQVTHASSKLITQFPHWPHLRCSCCAGVPGICPSPSSAHKQHLCAPAQQTILMSKSGRRRLQHFSRAGSGHVDKLSARLHRPWQLLPGTGPSEQGLGIQEEDQI